MDRGGRRWEQVIQEAAPYGLVPVAQLGYATPLLSTALLLLFGETLAPGGLLGSALVLVCSIGVLIMHRKVRG